MLRYKYTVASLLAAAAGICFVGGIAVLSGGRASNG